MVSSKVTKKQQFWFSHLETQKQSGLSQKAYCKEHSLSLVQMGYYSRIMTGKERGQRAKRSDFVKLPLASRLVRTQTLLFKLPSGVTLECPTNDLALLREVVKALS